MTAEAVDPVDTPSELTRVYAPATLSGLRALQDGAALPGTLAFAVTERLRSLLALQADDPSVEEELAEAAVVAAADTCLALLTQEPAAPRLRFVVAADILAVGSTDIGGHPAAVRCPQGGIPLAAVACLLADDPGEAGAAVAAALAAHDGGSDADIEDALDELDAHTLAWFDVSELDELIRRATDG